MNDNDYYNDDHDNYDPLKLLKETLRMITECQAEIESHTDPRNKEVGDRVYIVDGTGLIDVNDPHKKRYAIDEPIDNKLFVIVEKGKMPSGYSFDNRYEFPNDLKVVSVEDPTLVLYTSSTMVVLEDFKTPEKIFADILGK